MGKSPGKWIKTLLFGKKSSRLSMQKRRASNVGNSKDGNLGKDPTLAIDSSLNSEQIPNISGVNGITPKPQKGSSSDLHSGRETQTESNEKSSTVAGAPVQPQSSIEERAAIKAQSAFRGYLARRAFYALKGIIRLQALVRGHLTRRQALATLRCTWGIVKFQSLFQGSRTRENIDFEVIKSSYRPKACQASNALARKLVSSSISSKPLGFQYSREEPNSVSRWLDRWTFSVFWKPPPQPKKLPDSKPQGRRYAMETESGRSKRTVRKNLGSNSPADSALTNPPPELDKSKRNLRKISSYPLEISPENPQSELERVKRSLRKVSEIESEKTVKKDSSPVMANESVNALESNPLTTPVKIETVASANGDASTEEEASEENSKTSSKRRTSFSGVKPEYSENGLQHQHTPKLPSYMAATESAKARLRGQNSPRIGSEESDKTSFTRRHSLPSSINGKVNSVSPRIQRPVLAGGKGALRNERSVVSSRDGNDKPVQVEWKR